MEIKRMNIDELLELLGQSVPMPIPRDEADRRMAHCARDLYKTVRECIRVENTHALLKLAADHMSDNGATGVTASMIMEMIALYLERKLKENPEVFTKEMIAAADSAVAISKEAVNNFYDSRPEPSTSERAP